MIADAYKSNWVLEWHDVHSSRLTPAQHPWVLWPLFKKLVYDCRGLSALKETTAKWESCSLSALTFCFQEAPVLSQSVLQARQLLLEPEWQQLAPKFLVQVPFLLVSETDAVNQWLWWLYTQEEPPFFCRSRLFFLTELRNFCPLGRGGLLRACCISARFAISRVPIQMKGVAFEEGSGWVAR